MQGQQPPIEVTGDLHVCILFVAAPLIPYARNPQANTYANALTTVLALPQLPGDQSVGANNIYLSKSRCLIHCYAALILHTFARTL